MRNMFFIFGVNMDNVSLEGIEDWDVSNVTNMDNMFREAGYNSEKFSPKISNWDVSSVTNMYQMFYQAGYNSSSFELNIAGWDVSSVSNMTWMFAGAGLNADYTLDLTEWKGKVSNVTDKYQFDKGVENKVIAPWD